MTGALIGLTVSSPVIALPLAVASHFVLDSIPHYADDERVPINSKIFAIELAVDALLCGLLVLALMARTPDNWFVPSLAALAAASPDFMSIARYLRGIRRGDTSKDSKYTIRQFHTRIQNESPKAWPVEVIWALGCIVLLARAT